MAFGKLASLALLLLRVCEPVGVAHVVREAGLAIDIDEGITCE